MQVVTVQTQEDQQQGLRSITDMKVLPLEELVLQLSQHAKPLLFTAVCMRGQWVSAIECVRSCDQKPYLHNETKGGICIKWNLIPKRIIKFYFTPPTWPPFRCLLLQDGRRDVM